MGLIFVLYPPHPCALAKNQSSAFGKEYAKRASWIGQILLPHRCLPRFVSPRLQLSAAVKFATPRAVYIPTFVVVSVLVAQAAVTAFRRGLGSRTHRRCLSIDRQLVCLAAHGVG